MTDAEFFAAMNVPPVPKGPAKAQPDNDNDNDNSANENGHED